MDRAIRTRRHRPVLLIDVAIPVDIDPAVDRLDDVFRYELDDLERAAMRGRSTRASAATAAWALIDEAVAAFLGRQLARSVDPLIVALRRRFEATRDAVLAEEPANAVVATRLLVNRLLHEPSAELRNLAAEPLEREGAERLLALLFHLAAADPKEEP